MRHILPVLLLFLLLAACQSAQTPELTPEEVIERSAQRMLELEGFQVSIDRSGAPAILDPNLNISFGSLTGHYVAPDRIQAKVTVIAPGIVVEVDVISIDTTQWQTNIFTGQWEELPGDWGFNPAALLAAESGLPQILTTDFTELQIDREAQLEELPGENLFLISGNLAGETLYELSNGLIGPDSMDAQIWVDSETFELHRAILVEHAGDTEQERTWQIDFWDFNSVIDIQPPL